MEKEDKGVWRLALSPAQYAIWCGLQDGPVPPSELKKHTSNVSRTASELNFKLAMIGDGRRVVARRGREGFMWSIENDR